MNRFLKRSLQGLGVLALLVGSGALWKREEIARLMAVNSLFAPEKIVNNFSTMDSMFLSRPLSRGEGPVSPLPIGPAMALPAGMADWVVQRNVTALIVLKDGMIRHESYYLGTKAEDLRISWSMAKSVLSMLMGVVVAEGAIPSLDAAVVDYVPKLKGSAYDGVTIRQVLNMASGVRFNEDYLDFNSDINKMGRVLALGQSMDDFAAGLTEREAEPGARWHYVSIDTHVIGMVIRGATGKGIPELLEDRILAPMGLEAAPYYVTDGLGEAFVLGGLNMRTRDYARLGQMIAQKGMWQGRQVVPEAWVAESIAPTAPPSDELGTGGYGYQWWVPEGAGPGEVMARGIYGQYIWIDQARDIVIAVNAADRGFKEAGVDAANLAMFRALASGI